jgi:hypothetical protein
MKSKLPEANRLLKHPELATTEADGANGVFIFDHPKIDGYQLFCIVSDGAGWEHVSVTVATKIKGRKVERWVKDQFWNTDEAVMQLHPPAHLHVSTHPYCLHLWAPVGMPIPLPDPNMVGFIGDNIQK